MFVEVTFFGTEFAIRDHCLLFPAFSIQINVRNKNQMLGIIAFFFQRFLKSKNVPNKNDMLGIIAFFYQRFQKQIVRNKTLSEGV